MKKILLKENEFIDLEKLKKIKENGYEIIAREEIPGIKNYSSYKFKIESICSDCKKIYIKEIEDYKINEEINEQNNNYSSRKIKIGKYSDYKYSLKNFYCDECCDKLKKEYEQYIENKEIFKFKKIGIIGKGVSFSYTDVDFIVCFGLGWLIAFKNGKKFNVYSEYTIKDYLSGNIKEYDELFSFYSADARKEMLNSFYGELLEEKDENSLEILIKKLKKIGFENGNELEYLYRYYVYRHKDSIIRIKNYKSKECFYKVDLYEPV